MGRQKTLLTSKQAIQTTVAIIETFYRIKTLSRTIKNLSTIQDKAEQKSLMQKSGDIIAEILGDDLVTDGSETTIELNLAVLKFKHTIKKKKHWEINFFAIDNSPQHKYISSAFELDIQVTTSFAWSKPSEH